MRASPVLILLSSLVACHSGACPVAEEVTVSADDPRDADAVRRAIEAFAGWTHDGACIDEVAVTDELPASGVEGMVEGRVAWVRRDGADLEGRTRHQLCHAADLHLGLSTDPEDAERLATLCTEGPQRVEQLAYAVCEAGDDDARRVLDTVFRGDWPLRVTEGSWHFDPGESVGIDTDGTVVPSGEGAAVLAWSLAEGSARPVLRQADTGAVVTGPALPRTASWQLFGGGGEQPVLVARDIDGTHGWTLDLDAHETRPVSLPPDLAFDEAVVADGALWGAGTVGGVYGSWRVDLLDGHATPWSAPAVVERPMASHGRIAVPDGARVQVYDVASDTWTSWPLPLELTALEAMPDASGSLSVRWAKGLDRGLARLDAPEGVVQVDVGSCGDPIASDALGAWVAGRGQASWAAPDPARARLDVLRLELLR